MGGLGARAGLGCTGACMAWGFLLLLAMYRMHLHVLDVSPCGAEAKAQLRTSHRIAVAFLVFFLKGNAR